MGDYEAQAESARHSAPAVLTQLRSRLLLALSGLVGLAGFAFDLWSPRGVSDGVWYVAMVLIGLWLPSRKAPLVLAGIGTLLTLAGYLLSEPAAMEWMVLTNRGLALSVIWITAVLCFVQKRTGQRLAQEEAQARELQSEIYRMARRSELGEMVSAIAHELNQPLAALRNYVAAAQRSLQPSGPDTAVDVGEVMGKAMRQADRAAEVIHQLLRLLRSGTSERRPENINATVEEAAHFALIGTAEMNLDVRVELAPDLPPCVINRTQIQQVVINLIRNSVDALAACKRRELYVRTARVAPDRVEIVVADSGPGLAAEVREKLFMPFVTTKPNGIGIGLSIAYSIIEAHQGSLSAAAHKDSGTLFRAVLPALPG